MQTQQLSRSGLVLDAAVNFVTMMAHGLKTIVKAPVRYYRGRRVMSELAQMSEHHLRDIGLTYADLHAVNDRFAMEDPTQRLSERMRHQRRFNQSPRG